MADGKREAAWEKWIATESGQHLWSDGVPFRAGYDAALADNAERVREDNEASQAEADRVLSLPIEEVERELREAGVDVDLFERSTIALVNACKERNAALKQLADNAEREEQIKLEALEWRADRVKMIDALVEARDQARKANAEWAKAVLERDEARATMFTMEQQTASVADQYERLESKFNEVRAERDEARATIERLEQERDHQRDEYTKCVQTFEENAAGLRATIATLEDQLQEAHWNAMGEDL